MVRFAVTVNLALRARARRPPPRVDAMTLSVVRSALIFVIARAGNLPLLPVALLSEKVNLLLAFRFGDVAWAHPLGRQPILSKGC